MAVQVLRKPDSPAAQALLHDEASMMELVRRLSVVYTFRCGTGLPLTVVSRWGYFMQERFHSDRQVIASLCGVVRMGFSR